MIIPEFTVLNIVQQALDYIRNDYKQKLDKNETYLKKILTQNEIERYSLLDQAEQVFTNDPSDPRFIEVNLMFNMARENAPTIHITLPSEQSDKEGNGIGIDEGYEDDLIYNETITTQYTRRYSAQYSIVITSDNSNEVVLIYHVLRSILTSLTNHIHFKGLQNIYFSGQDVQINSDVFRNLYVRALSMNVQYDTSSPNLITQDFIKELTIEGIPVLS